MKNKVIMQCIVTGQKPEPFLTDDRQMECMIAVRPYTIVNVQKAVFMDVNEIPEIIIKVTDQSIWLHFARTQQYDCFLVCGELEKNVVTSRSMIKTQW